MAKDLQNLSDDELIAMASQKKIAIPSVQSNQGLDNLSDDELIQLHSQKFKPDARTGQAFLEGAGQSLSLGYLPQIQAAAESALSYLTPKSEGDIALEQIGAQAPQETYLSRRDENLRRQQQLQQEAPGSYAAGQVTGALVGSAAIPGGQAATGLSGRILQAGKTAALEGAAYNPGDTEGEYSGLQLAERGKQALVGSGLGVIGQLTGTGVANISEKLRGLPSTLKNYAELKAFKQTGAMLKDFRKNLGNNRANEIGRELLDKGIVETGDSFDDIYNKSSALKEEAGKELGDIYNNSIQKLGSVQDNPHLAKILTDSNIDATKISEKLKETIKKELKGKPGSSDVIPRIEKELETFAENGSNLDLPEAVKIKGAFDDLINYNKDVKDNTILQQQFKKIRDELNLAIDKRVDTIGKLTNDTELIKRLKDAKKTYGNMSEVSGIAKDRMARENANRFFSLGDRISGVSGAALGTIQSGDIEGAIKGGVAGLLIGKASRFGGNAISAKAIDRTAKILDKNPLLLGEFTAPLVEAAKRSPETFARTVERFRRDPEFKTIIEERKRAMEGR